MLTRILLLYSVMIAIVGITDLKLESEMLSKFSFKTMKIVRSIGSLLSIKMSINQHQESSKADLVIDR